MNSEPCPNAERLSDFLLGKLSEPEIDLLSLHLDGCADCQATVELLEEQQTLDESLVHELADAPGDAAMLAEPKLLSALVRLQQLGPPANRPRPAAPPIPATIAGYRVLEYLGQGGMGTVYKALHPQMERTVAVKLICAEGAGGREKVERFRREIKAQARLDHPNIVAAYDAGEFDGTLYLVMKYVDGIDLAKLLAAVGPLPVAEACELMKQAAGALDYYSARKLVHRDIKPSNLMLDNEGRLVVLDLGLALFQEDRPDVPQSEDPPDNHNACADGLTKTRQAMGSVDYMSPEQFEGSHTVDIRADIYSLGCTLFALLSGNAPFSAPEYPTLAAKQKGHAADPPPPPSQHRDDVPPAVWDIVQKMLRKLPGERYQTPRELADELAPFTGGSDLAELCARARGARETSVSTATWTAGEWPRSGGPAAAAPSRVQAAGGRAKTWSLARIPGRSLVRAAAAAGALAVLMGIVITIKFRDGSRQVVVLEHKMGAVESVEVDLEDKPRHAAAPQPQPTPRQEANAVATEAEVYTPLFNGRDLSGWTSIDPPDAKIAIADEILSVESGLGTDYLFTDRFDYRDFRFRGEFMAATAPEVASVLVRADPSPMSWGGMRGYLITVGRPANAAPGTAQSATTLSLASRERPGYELDNLIHGALSPAKWHQLEIIVTDNRIQVLVDGESLIDRRDEGRAFRRGAVALLFPPKTTSRYRNLELRELAPGIAAAEPSQSDRRRWAVWGLATPGTKSGAYSRGRRISGGLNRARATRVLSVTSSSRSPRRKPTSTWNAPKVPERSWSACTATVVKLAPASTSLSLGDRSRLGRMAPRRA